MMVHFVIVEMLIFYINVLTLMTCKEMDTPLSRLDRKT